MSESPPTGMMTPQTVIAPILPVMLGPPKFATVVSQSRAITPMQVAIGVDDSHGKNAGKIAHRGNRDRNVADGKREEVEEEHEEIAGFAVGVLGIGGHAAGAGVENARLGKAIGDGHRAERRHSP